MLDAQGRAFAVGLQLDGWRLSAVSHLGRSAIPAKEMLMMGTISTLCLAVALASCGVTQRAAVTNPARAGMLDYSLLSPGGAGRADLRYINPRARWTEYRKIIIDPVTFWAGANSIPAADQQALCDFMYQALVQQFGKRFTIVQQLGPATMRLHVAIVSATAATPALRSVSMLVPQARVLATLKYLATGTYPFVGGAQVEARITDDQSGEILGEWVEHYIGGGSLQTAAQWKWGDAENAMNSWAATSATRLASWTSGTVAP
jgi:hypothetical protein